MTVAVWLGVDNVHLLTSPLLHYEDDEMILYEIPLYLYGTISET